MTENIPKWITNLALDIYKLIIKYNAMSRFQEMVNKWAEEHEAEIEKHREWNEQRRLHFEETIASDPRLQDKESGSPEDGWQFEHHVQHTEQKTESGWQRSHSLIHGWVPPELSTSAKPEITHLLPLSRDYELSLAEKYTVLAAIYDYGRKGTSKIPPWPWPESDKWDAPDSLSNAKKSIFFESLCNATKLVQDDEGWLRALLDEIEKDMRNWRGVESPKPKENMQTNSSGTRTDKCIKKIKNNPVISGLIVIGIVIISLGAVFGSIEKIVSFWNKITHKQVDSPKPSQDIMDTRILTATATVEITIRSEEQVNARHSYQGAVLAFGKGKEALLLLSSKESTAKQMDMAEVRYSSELDMKPTDKAFKQPLSLLEQVEYAQVRFEIIPPDSEVLSGTVICIFNNNIPIELSVPSQKMLGNLITIRHIDIGEALQQHTKSR